LGREAAVIASGYNFAMPGIENPIASHFRSNGIMLTTVAAGADCGFYKAAKTEASKRGKRGSFK